MMESLSVSRRDLLWQYGGGLGGIALASLFGREQTLPAAESASTTIGQRTGPGGGVVEVLHIPPKATRVVQFFMLTCTMKSQNW